MATKHSISIDHTAARSVFLVLAVVLTYYLFAAWEFDFEKNPVLYFVVLIVALVPSVIFSALMYDENDEFSPRKAPARLKYFLTEVLPELIGLGIRTLAFYVSIGFLILTGIGIVLGVLGLIKFGIEQL